MQHPGNLSFLECFLALPTGDEKEGIREKAGEKRKKRIEIYLKKRNGCPFKLSFKCHISNSLHQKLKNKKTIRRLLRNSCDYPLWINLPSELFTDTLVSAYATFTTCIFNTKAIALMKNSTRNGGRSIVCNCICRKESDRCKPLPFQTWLD